jgi:hypothetical protein
MNGIIHRKNFSTTRGGCIFLLMLLFGCSPAGPGKPGTTGPTQTTPGDSPAKRTADKIAWNNRAAELFPKITDNASADAHVTELLDLVRSAEDLDKRSKGTKPWERTKEENDALDKEFGEDLKASTKRFISAASVFEHAKSKELVRHLRERHGIDILRTKMVTKK